MSDAEPIEAASLKAPRARHAFFTRRGGVSEGIYRSLNGGVGSRDAPSAVAENRARMAKHFHVAPDRLAIPFQIHSSDALVIDAPFTSENRPRCDALVTTTPGLALGVTGADCGVVLFLDADAGVIGAAHAGWKGALGGVIEATVGAMERGGAKRRAIRAALGPSIAQKSYEVGPEFLARFVADDPASLAHSSSLAPVPTGTCSICKATSESGRGARASAHLRISASTPMPTRSGSTAIAVRRIGRNPTTAASSRRSRWTRETPENP